MDDLTRVVNLYKHSKSMSPDDVLAEVQQLTDPVFSARMLKKVTGLSIRALLGALGKTQRTGGRLDPETLETILELRTYGFDRGKVLWCIKKGTSQTLLARLTGISQSRISRVWSTR